MNLQSILLLGFILLALGLTLWRMARAKSCGKGQCSSCSVADCPLQGSQVTCLKEGLSQEDLAASRDQHRSLIRIKNS